jgi:hypothetical protein
MKNREFRDSSCGFSCSLVKDSLEIETAFTPWNAMRLFKTQLLKKKQAAEGKIWGRKDLDSSKHNSML